MGLAPHGVQLTLLVSRQADVLHGVGQPLAHHLLHPDLADTLYTCDALSGSYRVPTVDEAVETDDSDLLGPVVVAERPHPVRLFALLHHQRLGVVVARVVCARHLLCNIILSLVIRLLSLTYHVVRDPPERETAVPGAGHQELIIQPGLDKTSFTGAWASDIQTWSNIQSEWAFSPTQMGSRVGRR